MDYTEVKGEIPVEEQLEPLVILEEGDDPGEFTNNLQGLLRTRKAKEEEGSLKASAYADPDTESGRSVQGRVGISQVEEKEARQQEERLGHEDEEDHQLGTAESVDGRFLEAPAVTPAQPGAGSAMSKPAGEEKEETEAPTDRTAEDETHVPPQASIGPQRRDLLKPEDAQQKSLQAHRWSHDFPDTLYELLCALQEGRRLNDQRCSFQLQGRRRCHSEPATPRHSQKVVFSSMTSLQREEFFELVATSQSRRLDDQRAELQTPPAVLSPAESRRPSSAAKVKARKGSCKPSAAAQPAPAPPPKEELYNMIVISQAQGRLEEQRCAAPGPMDDEDFFSLLLKVQGGRIDEQRTELPVALKY